LSKKYVLRNLYRDMNKNNLPTVDPLKFCQKICAQKFIGYRWYNLEDAAEDNKDIYRWQNILECTIKNTKYFLGDEI
jgi:hypothetical protein